MLLFIFEILGTVAFAISGALVAIEKKMDILGVAVLGATTAVGGGILRDIVLGYTPPNAFRHPVYSVVAIIVSLIMFSSRVRHLFQRVGRYYELFVLFIDALGLGIFTVVGIQVAHNLVDTNPFLYIFVGVVTGVGGGVIRDLFAANKPYIFVKHFYASASIIGAVSCVILWPYWGETWSMITGTFLVIGLRLLAAYYRAELPRPKD